MLNKSRYELDKKNASLKISPSPYSKFRQVHVLLGFTGIVVCLIINCLISKGVMEYTSIQNIFLNTRNFSNKNS